MLIVAPARAALSVARRTRSARSPGNSDSGVRPSRGSVTVSAGASGGTGGVPYTLGSQPVNSGAVSTRTAKHAPLRDDPRGDVVDDRRRMPLLLPPATPDAAILGPCGPYCYTRIVAGETPQEGVRGRRFRCPRARLAQLGSCLCAAEFPAHGRITPNARKRQARSARHAAQPDTAAAKRTRKCHR